MATLPGMPHTDEPEPDALPVEPDDGGRDSARRRRASEAARGMTRGGWLRVWALVIPIVAVLVFAAWASDFITMQGERTIYTVDCRQGDWKDDVCSGTLVPGLRYRYRALKPHREVIFWTLGTKDRSGKFEDCDIEDGRNWLCRPNADIDRSITREMAQGDPVPGPLTRSFRAVSKWRWLVLERGFGGGASVAAPRAPASAASAA